VAGGMVRAFVSVLVLAMTLSSLIVGEHRRAASRGSQQFEADPDWPFLTEGVSLFFLVA
jgi:hypothetical protein